MSGKPYTFNWHDLDEFEPYEEFLRWALVHLTVDTDEEGNPRRLSTEEYERIGQATDRFKTVSLTVQIGGVDVDPEHLMRGIERNMKHYARQTARDELERLAEFRSLRADVEGFERVARQRLNDLAVGMGLEPLETEEDDL